MNLPFSAYWLKTNFLLIFNFKHGFIIPIFLYFHVEYIRFHHKDNLENRPYFAYWLKNLIFPNFNLKYLFLILVYPYFHVKYVWLHEKDDWWNLLRRPLRQHGFCVFWPSYFWWNMKFSNQISTKLVSKDNWACKLSFETLFAWIDWLNHEIWQHMSISTIFFMCFWQYFWLKLKLYGVYQKFFNCSWQLGL